MNKYTILVHTKADIPAIDGICRDAIRQALLPYHGSLAIHFGFGRKDEPHTIIISMEDECPNIDALCMDALSMALKPYDDSPGLSFFFGDAYAAPEINDAPGPGLVEGPACDKDTGRFYTEVEGTLKFHFGKNGGGLSDELLKIGQIINELSQHNFIVMQEAFVDSADDVYDLTFYCSPKEQ